MPKTTTDDATRLILQNLKKQVNDMLNLAKVFPRIPLQYREHMRTKVDLLQTGYKSLKKLLATENDYECLL